MRELSPSEISDNLRAIVATEDEHFLERIKVCCQRLDVRSYFGNLLQVWVHLARLDLGQQLN